MLLPLEGTTLRSALRLPEPTRGAELHGAGLAFSALKDAENGECLIARCVNLLDEPVDGAWRFGFSIREAVHAQLDETPLRSLSIDGDLVPFRAPPRGVVTILIR